MEQIVYKVWEGKRSGKSLRDAMEAHSEKVGGIDRLKIYTGEIVKDAFTDEDKEVFNFEDHDVFMKRTERKTTHVNGQIGHGGTKVHSFYVEYIELVFPDHTGTERPVRVITHCSSWCGSQRWSHYGGYSGLYITPNAELTCKKCLKRQPDPEPEKTEEEEVAAPRKKVSYDKLLGKMGPKTEEPVETDDATEEYYANGAGLMAGPEEEHVPEPDDSHEPGYYDAGDLDYAEREQDIFEQGFDEACDMSLSPEEIFERDNPEMVTVTYIVQYAKSLRDYGFGGETPDREKVLDSETHYPVHTGQVEIEWKDSWEETEGRVLEQVFALMNGPDNPLGTVMGQSVISQNLDVPHTSMSVGDCMTLVYVGEEGEYTMKVFACEPIAWKELPGPTPEELKQRYEENLDRRRYIGRVMPIVRNQAIRHCQVTKVTGKYVDFEYTIERTDRDIHFRVRYDELAGLLRISDINRIVKDRTAFETMDEMINQPGGYRPTIRPEDAWDRVMIVVYGQKQFARGDSRTSHSGDEFPDRSADDKISDAPWAKWTDYVMTDAEMAAAEAEGERQEYLGQIQAEARYYEQRAERYC